MCFDGWAFILAFISYCFLIYKLAGSSPPLKFQYFSVIAATTHLCVFVFLVILDFIFKSDTMFVVGQSESNNGGGMSTVTTFGLSETNKIIQPQIEEENCFQQNPCALYRKHYIISGLKILFVIFDIVVLSMMGNGWRCTDPSYKC